MEPLKKYAMIHKYKLCRLLGKGGFATVKYAYDILSKQYFATKIIRHSSGSASFELAIKEINILRALDHPNIVRLIEFYIDIDYIKKNGTSYKVVALVLEHIEGPNLAQFLQGGRLQESIARKFFIEIIQTLEYLHDLGLSHRDISLSNLVLDRNYRLKIVDFGLTNNVRTSKEIKSIYGTQYAMAPELFLGMSDDGACTDLFAAAVCLFMMVAGNTPFYAAISEDPRYKLIIDDKYDEFWTIHEITASNGDLLHTEERFYNEDFRSLMNAMLSHDRSTRLTLDKVKAHPWLKGDVATCEEICEEFNLRKKVMKAASETYYIAKNRAKVHVKNLQETEIE